MGKKVLLVNPYQTNLYIRTKIRAGAIYSPSLTLATLAGGLIKYGHKVKIIDLNLDTLGKLSQTLHSFQPEFVGITFTTPLFDEVMRCARLIKKCNKKITLISGGPHISSFPEHVLNKSPIDIAVIGEGDITLPEIVNGQNLDSIQGICYNNDGRIVLNRQRAYIKELDDLPYPAWELYDLTRYRTTELLTRTNPAGWIETSRGCPYNCAYCNKNIFGNEFRAKSPKRVVDEIEYMLKIGFREIHIADDNFTMDMERAKEICNEIIRRKLKFPWATLTGIRIDRVDKELLYLLHKAGCYRVLYGIESGNQEVLDSINKGITLQEVRKVVNESKDTGLEVFGSFMIALPRDTEESMRDTINFAKELPFDLVKLSVTVPLPSTPLFNELDKKGLIKTYNWFKYNLYLPAHAIYEHPNVSWNRIEFYFNRFYREFYLRPSFASKWVLKSMIRGKLISSIRYFFQTKW